MLSKVWRRLCDFTAGKTRPCDAGNAMTRAFDIGRSAPMSDADAPSVAGNILRLLCEISAGPSTPTTKLLGPDPARNPASKREKPRPWQVRGSRAEALPRFWLIVMLHR